MAFDDKTPLRGVVSAAAMESQAEMLANRVRKTWRRWRRRFERQSIGAFRLYDRDIPEIRLVVDWYEGHAVIAEYERAQTRLVDGWLERMGQAVVKGLGIPPNRLHLKRRRTRPRQGERYQRLGRKGAELEVREGTLRFLVNLDDHIDTGLFADHRQTRRLVAEESAGCRFLNLFAYTGTFTCSAAAGRAASTTTVDLSKNYIAWARENLALNGFAPSEHEFSVADVSQFLRCAAEARRRWDLVVCDPPSFSTTGGPAGRFDVQQDHPWLLEQVQTVVAHGGVVYFSTNHQRFTPRLHGVGAKRIEELTQRTVPPDYRNRTVHRCWRITL